MDLKCGGCASLHTDFTTLKACGYCKKVYYCNKMCQEAGWKTHKLECKKLASHIRVNDVIKYYFGEYFWYVSENIHAHYSYYLSLENAHTPTFRLSRRARVENVNRSQEYIGTFYPIVQDINDKSLDFTSLFDENTKTCILLKGEYSLTESVKKESNLEFILRFVKVKSSPKNTFWVTCHPFSAFQEHRIVLTGYPFELQKINVIKQLENKVTYQDYYKLLEYELDFFQSTGNAIQVFQGKKLAMIGVNEHILYRLKSSNRWNEILSLQIAKYESWIEVARTMHDEDDLYQKTITRILEDILETLGQISKFDDQEALSVIKGWKSTKQEILHIQKHFDQ